MGGDGGGNDAVAGAGIQGETGGFGVVAVFQIGGEDDGGVGGV